MTGISTSLYVKSWDSISLVGIKQEKNQGDYGAGSIPLL